MRHSCLVAHPHTTLPVPFTHPSATVPVHVTQDRRCSFHFARYLYISRVLDRSSDQLQPVEWWVVAGRGHLRRCVRPLEDETRRRAMAPTRDHNRPVPLSHVGKALGRLKSSIQSLQRKISRLPRGEVLVVVKCVKKNRQGQEAEEWALHGSGALQRAIRPYLSQIIEIDTTSSDARAIRVVPWPNRRRARLPSPTRTLSQRSTSRTRVSSMAPLLA